MFALSRREMHDAERSISGHTRSLRAGSGKSAHLQASLLEYAEVGGGLFAWGLANGRFGVIAPMGVSLDLMVGVLLGGLAAFDVVPAITTHANHLATASLGSFLMRKGVQTGTSMRTAAGLPALAAADLGTGIFGGEFARNHAVMSGNAPRDLSDAELAAMATAARR